MLFRLDLIIENFVRHVDNLDEGPLLILFLIFQLYDFQVNIFEFWSILLYFNVCLKYYVVQKWVLFSQDIFKTIESFTIRLKDIFFPVYFQEFEHNNLLICRPSIFVVPPIYFETINHFSEDAILKLCGIRPE